MVKRRTQNSDDFYIESGDDPIGLTGAFIPVKGPQSVEYSDDDDPVGLTQAFGAIPDQDEQRSWDEAVSLSLSMHCIAVFIAVS